MPLWEEFDFEFDLMTNDALADAESAVGELGASRVVIHAGAPHAREAIDFLQPYRGGGFPVAVGLALPCDATPEVFADCVGKCDFTQVMGIAHSGHQHLPFDERALATVAALRAAYPMLFIQVDGGVQKENFQALLAAGADRLVVGSAYRDIVGE
jgi:pentose-5-phosphate-3-epimerase